MLQFLVWRRKFELPAEIRVTGEKEIQRRKWRQLYMENLDETEHENYPRKSTVRCERNEKQSAF